MEIYVEYAVLENCLVDGALLYLAQAATKRKIALLRLLIASAFGAGFALLFPLLSLPTFLGWLLKLFCGAFLCAIAIKRQKDGGRYALTVILFFAFSFCFGGGLLFVLQGLGTEYYTVAGGGVVTRIPVGALLAAAAVFTAFCRWGIRRLYARKRVFAHIVLCTLTRGQRSVEAQGFVDTGNGASYGGRAVCFVTPDLLFELCGTAAPDGAMTVKTVAGEKRISLFLIDEITICDGNKRGEERKLGGVYLSPAVHIVGKPYKLLLPQWNN